MARAFRALIERLRSAERRLKFESSPEWGANAPLHRAEIRRSLKSALARECAGELALFEDMTAPPRPAHWSVSVSHSRDFGAWLAVPRPARIGFDVESRARIRLQVIERACSAREVESAPDPVFLWPAKEALFKALEEHQPAAITQLTIRQWEQIEPDLFRFRSPDAEGFGLVSADAQRVYGAFLVESLSN